jgi:3-oxoacyl-[acyl-carrier-protein] synthase II
MALQHSGLTLTDENRARVGVVLGTNVGSIKSIGDFMRDTLIHERPYLVNPMNFPNSVMNCAAGQSAIWHKLKGINATISAGRLAGLMALRYAGMTLRLGYADAVITGSVEEFCEQTAWAFHHTGRVDPARGAPLGEGCAVFTLENAEAVCAQGRKVLAEVLACEVGVYSPDIGGRARQAQGLAACIRRALSRAGVGARDVWAVSAHQFADAELEEVESHALELALDGHVPARQVIVGKSVGECFSAAGAFQLAALLALFGDAQGDRVALVTSLAHSGAVGCADIREGGPWLE